MSKAEAIFRNIPVSLRQTYDELAFFVLLRVAFFALFSLEYGTASAQFG